MDRKALILILGIFLISFVSAEITTINTNSVYPGQSINLVIKPNRQLGFYPIIYVMRGSDVVDLIDTGCSNPCTERRTVIAYTVPSTFGGNYAFATFDYAVPPNGGYEFDNFTVLAQPDFWQVYDLNIENLENPIPFAVNPKQGANASIW